jgi:hypothetical protein
MDIAASLNATCVGLLDTALNTLVGATEITLSPARVHDKNVKEMLQWRGHELRMHAEIADYKSALKRSVRSSTEDLVGGNSIPSDEQLSRSIAKLQDELYEYSSKHQRDELLVRRIIQAPMVSNAFNLKNQTEDNKYIRDTTKFRDEKVLQMMKKLQQLRALRSQTEDIKRRGLDVHAQNCNLHTTLQKKRSSTDPHSCKSSAPDLHDELDIAYTRASILRHVLRAIILESGVNWARRQELRDFMLQESM